MTSSWIAAARASLTSELAGVTTAGVFPAWPSPLSLPALVITEDDPFITEDTYGTAQLSFSVLAMVRAGVPAVMVSQLDALAAAVIGQLGDRYGWQLGAYRTITGPDSQPILTATITVTTTQEVNP